MDVAVIGVNHHLAPIQIREKVSFTDSQKIEAINVLLDQDINEIVILSTCNRSEIYIHANTIDEKINVIKNFYEEFFHDDEIKNFLFSKTGERAMGHLFEVASGLDSIVLGEDQILGQVKKAHEFSMQLGASKKYFNKLFREAIMTAKEIKNTTKISEQPLSISYIAIKLLKEKNMTVTTAESCTGGMIASAIVSVAGASACFKEGYITYSNEAKKKLLGVREDTLKQHTVVSAQVAQEMAAGAAAAAQSSLAVSVTGVAGPDPDEGNPVGLVYIGIAFEGSVYAARFQFTGSREEIRRQAACEALALALGVVSE